MKEKTISVSEYTIIWFFWTDVNYIYSLDETFIQFFIKELFIMKKLEVKICSFEKVIILIYIKNFRVRAG